MADEDFYPHLTECSCTNPVTGGKLWLCDTEQCQLNDSDCTHGPDKTCETCRFWGA